MIKTGEISEERRARHRKEFVEGLGDVSKEAARVTENFYFRPGGLYEIDLERGSWAESDRLFSGIAEPFWKKRLS
jgi:hypothetical protein